MNSILVTGGAGFIGSHLAEGLAANPDPLEALRASGVPVVPIGDVDGVGYIEGAIHQGFRAAVDL